MKPLFWLFSFSLIATPGRVVNFDTAQIGKAPAGWTVTGTAPRWEIRKDHTAPTQPYVLAHSSPESTPHTPLAIFDSMSLRDMDVSVRLKPLSGHDSETGGVVWRYRDENNYYLARANAHENDVQIFKVENGRRIPLNSGVKHPIPLNAWSILKVSVRGPKFQVYVDHRRVLEAEDTTFRSAGKVGLWTLPDSVTYFDDFRVYPK